jgi:hypothetical protein
MLAANCALAQIPDVPVMAGGGAFAHALAAGGHEASWSFAQACRREAPASQGRSLAWAEARASAVNNNAPVTPGASPTEGGRLLVKYGSSGVETQILS